MISIIDTNYDPAVIDCLISGNDDAIKACKLITSYVANAVIEGKRFYTDSESKAKAKEEKKAKEDAKESDSKEVKEKLEDKSSKDNNSSISTVYYWINEDDVNIFGND